MKLEEIEIESFRGIPDKLNISLQKNGKSVSAILFGDNGTGKSSIIDSIEFCLQARINKTQKIFNEFNPFPNSLNSNNLPKVKIKFDNGKGYCERGINIKSNSGIKSKFKYTNPNGHINFGYCPIVIRRKDLLEFHLTPIREKKKILYEYIRFDEKRDFFSKEMPIEVENLENEKYELKLKRIKIRREIALLLEVDETKIPIGKDSFENFLHKEVYKGIPYPKRRNKKTKDKSIILDDKLKNGINKMHGIQKELQKKSLDIRRLKKTIMPKFDRSQHLKETLENASVFITKGFKEISKLKFINDIYLENLDKNDAKLVVKIKLTNGKIESPNNVFSEAYLDLIALLIFVSFLRESAKLGQSKILVLDDVVQSVDSTIRYSFMDFLLKEFSDWQIIISVHDRLWFNQVRGIFRRHNHVFKELEIIRWDFLNGPIIRNSSPTISNLLNNAINQGEFELVCSQTGIFLEQICTALSFELPISIKRRYEDKYTLGDLWPGVYKILKKTNVFQSAEKVDKLIHIRNLIGAHYNSWALSLSSSEAFDFGESVLDLYQNIFCSSCENWIANINNEKLWTCKCKTVIVK